MGILEEDNLGENPMEDIPEVGIVGEGILVVEILKEDNLEGNLKEVVEVDKSPKGDILIIDRDFKEEIRILIMVPFQVHYIPMKH